MLSPSSRLMSIVKTWNSRLGLRSRSKTDVESETKDYITIEEQD